ncbi:FeoB-associated Cys-rich membrane protein [Maribellus maritimus]|nr:FeoB-associated Cys-rich membrane protein [Maribellus maritimus]
MLDFQNIIVYIVVLASVVWLFRKFFWKKRKNSSSECGNAGCSCH